MIRSVAAVLAGIIVLTTTSFAIEFTVDPLLMRLFPNSLPDQAAISHNLPATIFMFVYSGLCIAAGGYVCAWVARRKPVPHALAMGVVQTGLTVMAMLAMKDHAPMLNWIEALSMTIPLSAAGGLVWARRTAGPGSSR